MKIKCILKSFSKITQIESQVQVIHSCFDFYAKICAWFDQRPISGMLRPPRPSLRIFWPPRPNLCKFDQKWVWFHRLNFKHFDQTLAWLNKFWHQSTLLAKLGCVVTISIKYGSILKPLITYRFVSITLGYNPPAWTNFNYVGPTRLNLGTLWPSQLSIDVYTTGNSTIHPIPSYPLPNCPKPFKPCAFFYFRLNCFAITLNLWCTK